MAASRPEFAPDADRLLFTGEHIFPWYYEEDPSLRPLAEVANLLAEKKDWGRLYDHAQLQQERGSRGGCGVQPRRVRGL